MKISEKASIYSGQQPNLTSTPQLLVLESGRKTNDTFVKDDNVLWLINTFEKNNPSSVPSVHNKKELATSRPTLTKLFLFLNLEGCVKTAVHKHDAS